MTTRCLGCLLLASFLAMTGGARAAEPDLRLVTAIQAQDGPAVRALLREGVDVNAVRADGATALLWAAHWDDLDTADLLLAAGADVNVAEDQGVTPLALACENASAPMVAKLLAAGADPHAAQANGVTPLMMAARTGEVEIVRTLLARDVSVTAAIPTTGQTALMWATAERHWDIMRELIAAGADVEARSKIGFTPLLFVTRNGDREAAEILIAAGADVNTAGSDGTHALPLAIVSGHDAFARFLLEQGADPDSTIHGIGALHAAVSSVDMWLRDWLRVRGVSVFSRTTAGLDAASRIALVHTLLDHGADPNARIDASTTVETFVSGRHGAFETQSIGTGNLRDATPLWIAAYSANRGRDFTGRDMKMVETMGVLLEAGADPHLTTYDGTTPLMVAAGIGHASFLPGQTRSMPNPSAGAAVTLLVEAGSDVNAVNEADFTALHGAAFGGLNTVIEYLVEHGADIDAQDFRGRTAYRIAQGTQQTFYVQEWPATATLLESLGADINLGVGGRDHERELGRRLAEETGKP